MRQKPVAHFPSRELDLLQAANLASLKADIA
jgi:hypothetical protein